MVILDSIYLEKDCYEKGLSEGPHQERLGDGNLLFCCSTFRHTGVYGFRRSVTFCDYKAETIYCPYHLYTHENGSYWLQINGRILLISLKFGDKKI